MTNRVGEFSFFPKCTLFFISNTFISNARLNLANNQENAMQHPEAELLTFENYSRSSCTLPTKNNSTYSKKEAVEQVSLFHEIIRLIIMKMELKMKNISHR